MFFVVAVLMLEEKKGLVVRLEEDRIFGEMEHLIGMCKEEEITVTWQRCSLALVERMKR